jgi:nucleoside phosphorylase
MAATCYLDSADDRAVPSDMEGLPGTTHAREKRSSEHDTATDVQPPKRRRRATKALPPKSYTIAWICALHIELAAARAMLDGIHPDVPRDKGDKNIYVLGSIGKYNVVIACLPEGHYGTINAGRVLADLRRTFTEIWAGFMVGIGGGAPSDRNDIRLGDVVVGTRVMPYELGKILAGGEIERTAIQKAPDFLLCSLVSKVRAVAESDQERSRISSIVEERFADMPDFGRPDDPDLLFHAAYPHDENSLMDTCSGCDQSKLVPRRQRNTKGPTMHYGGIASGDKVVKDGLSRDRLAKTLRVLCFEMEAAGLMDILPCLPIRGICDYSDSHKRKGWQKFAAANAAAYARLLLETLSDGTYEPSEPGEFAIYYSLGSVVLI